MNPRVIIYSYSSILKETLYSIHSLSTTQERGRREKDREKRSMREGRERGREEFAVRKKLNVIGGKLPAINRTSPL